MILALILALTADSYSLNAEAGVTPVQKVVQLMQDMYAKGKQEKHDETVAFATYTQFCKDTMDSKQKAVADGASEIERLAADIGKAQSDASVLGKEIAALGAQSDEWNKELSAAQKVRAAEKTDYVATHRDYNDSTDALDRAIAILKRQAHDRRQAEALLQVAMLQRVPESAKRTIANFLETDAEVIQDPLSVSAPQANGYEFQSGGVVEMLENLKDKFSDERNQLEKDELNGKHAFEMMAQELHDSIEDADKQAAEKSKFKAQREQDFAEAKGDKEDASATKKEDEKYLHALVNQCDAKSRDFESRQKLRGEELEAISKAIEIIQSPSVAGHADTHLPQLLQKSVHVSHVLLRSSAVRPIQKNVAAFLDSAASKINSRVLSLVAVRMREDPFDKVKKMIKDLIVRLMEEAGQESEHKGWCDTELTTNKQTRETKSEDVEMLVAKRDGLYADIAKLAEEITGISGAIGELDIAVAKATENRGTEKPANAKTISESQEAQEAVAQAIEVLNEFYASAAEATAFIQSKGKAKAKAKVAQKQSPDLDAPSTFDTAYTGMSAEGGGVVGMLEVIQSDFARLEAETRASESESDSTFTKFSDESAQDKAVKQTELDHREKTKTEKESDLNDTEKDLSSTQTELDAAMQYYEKLKPSCVDSGLSYQERVGRREEEIQSLKEALRILEGEDIA